MDLKGMKEPANLFHAGLSNRTTADPTSLVPPL